MKCPYCGKELISEATRCDGCGAEIPNQYQNNNQTVTNYYQQQNNGNNKSGIPVILLFIVIIVALSYFLFFTGGSSSNSENTANKEEPKNEATDDSLIIKSKKQSYIDTARAYIGSIKMEVNDGRKLKVYDTKALYLIPVGDRIKCGDVESGGSSPFSKEWNYAYVGVTYNGEQYTYYFISEDDKLNGIPFTEYSKLDYELVYSYHNGVITDEISSKLKELYNITENKTLDLKSIGILKDVLAPLNKEVSKYIIVSASAGCRC